MIAPFGFDYNNLYQNAKKNAARRGIPFELSHAEFNSLVEASKGKCAFSGITFRLDQPCGVGTNRPFAPSLDRKDSKLGYTKTNCRLVCIVVNYAFHEYGDGPLLEIIETMVAAKTSRAATRITNAVQRRREALIDARCTAETYLTSGRFRQLFDIPDDVHLGALTRLCSQMAISEGVPIRIMANPNYSMYGSASVRVTPISFTKAFPLHIWRRAAKERRLDRKASTRLANI